MNEDNEFDFDTEEYNYVDTDPYPEFIPNRVLYEDYEYNPYDY